MLLNEIEMTIKCKEQQKQDKKTQTCAY